MLVYNTLGKIMHVATEDFAKGKNRYILDATQFSAGILYIG